MGRTDRAETLMSTVLGAVWDALTDPRLVARWLPPEGMEAKVDAWEPWPEGLLRLVLTYRNTEGALGKSSETSDAVTGRFLDAEAPARLVWATTFDGAGPEFEGEMTMAWTLSPEGRGTRVAIEARNVPPGISAEDHARGMGASLRQLSRVASELRR